MSMLLSRMFLLKLSGNKSKTDTARYTYEKHLMYVRHWVNLLYFNGNKAISTEGMGQLANQAQHRARAIIAAQTASTKATGNKSNVPQITRIGCPAKLGLSTTKDFDYWLLVENEFKKSGRIALPCQSHIRLNKFLKDGWTLNMESAELVYRGDVAYAHVCVQKEVDKAEPKTDTLGCDVGYRNSVSRSDGYVGKNTAKIIAKQRKKEKAQKRQDTLRANRRHPRRTIEGQLWFTKRPLKKRHCSKKLKTVVKQILDAETRRAILVSKRGGKTLVVESPKVIANLKSGSLQGWARGYFASRAAVLGAENGVFVWSVNPAWTSVTCNGCGKIERQSRVGSRFECVACGHVAHADVQAAKNIAQIGRRTLRALLKRRAA